MPATCSARPARTNGCEHQDHAAEILRGILQGCSYAELAARYEVTKSLIEHRAKHLAAQLCRQGLLPGLAEHHLSSAKHMRRHAPALLRALHEAHEAHRAIHCRTSPTSTAPKYAVGDSGLQPTTRRQLANENGTASLSGSVKTQRRVSNLTSRGVSGSVRSRSSCSSRQCSCTTSSSVHSQACASSSR